MIFSVKITRPVFMADAERLVGVGGDDFGAPISHEAGTHIPSLARNQALKGKFISARPVSSVGGGITRGLQKESASVATGEQEKVRSFIEWC